MSQTSEAPKFTGSSAPIYGTDLSKPLSALMEDWRKQITKIRGQMGDVAFAKSGWREDMAMLEGGLTCMLIAMHYAMVSMQEHEALAERERQEAASAAAATPDQAAERCD